MIVEVFLSALILICIFNGWVTRRVFQDGLSSSSQRIAQVALIWLVPAVGALVVLNLQRREGEKGPGRYRDPPNPGDDFGHPRLVTRNASQSDED
jgi:hypothetical protein